MTLRPLKYDYLRGADGQFATDHAGNKNPNVDLVILASSDSDLAPALDEVQRLGTAKVQTFCWYDQTRRVGYQLHPTDRRRPVWNTRLNESAFLASWDPTTYS